MLVTRVKTMEVEKTNAGDLALVDDGCHNGGDSHSSGRGAMDEVLLTSAGWR